MSQCSWPPSRPTRNFLATQAPSTAFSLPVHATRRRGRLLVLMFWGACYSPFNLPPATRAAGSGHRVLLFFCGGANFLYALRDSARKLRDFFCSEQNDSDCENDQQFLRAWHFVTPFLSYALSAAAAAKYLSHASLHNSQQSGCRSARWNASSALCKALVISGCGLYAAFSNAAKRT